ncbi:hypothetical protein GYH30_025881 [Glycine max]|nr:hypothetical protein GYH30_025881 [Glycine max]
MEAMLQFAPMQSSVDVGFWHRLTILQFPYSGYFTTLILWIRMTC